MKKDKKPFLTVGIGASAGGLAVLKEFIATLPKNPGMAFIIIQHLDPTHKSLLTELLAKNSKIKIKEAADKEKIEKDTIYVIPENKYLSIKDKTIKLSPHKKDKGSRETIDMFFHSLSESCKNQCAGIVLSGTGSDGTKGLEHIKASGGLVIAQNPDTAEYNSMPISAINAGVVDKSLHVKKIYEALKEFAEHPFSQSESNDDEKPPSFEEGLEDITAILSTHEDFNLRQYKPATVQRRIARRMSLTNTLTYADYLKKLRKDHKERIKLTEDLLINITDFFRDPEAFEILEQKIIPNILSNLEKDEDVRIWIAGCASGEEAYSLAILFVEALAQKKMNNGIRIFATDIDEQAIKTARKGVYSRNIENIIPQDYLEKYFTPTENEDHYKIKNQIRDLISFAMQNVAMDPPFSHMHLISCRNLLIYLKKNVQEKVLNSFYFALEEGAYLFLGSSETLGKKSDLFKTTSKKWRIYQKVPGQNQKQLLDHLHYESNVRRREKEAPRRSPRRREPLSRTDLIRQSILDAVVPATVLVDEIGHILYNHGDLQQFLVIPAGEPRNDIIQMVYPSLRSRLRSALYKVKKHFAPVTFHCALGKGDSAKTVRVDLHPIKEQDFVDGQVVAIVFQEDISLSENQKNELTQADEKTANHNLEQELNETKEELQNTIEELETSTEELKASHEEALSTNEELQSANEELEASSEELRSLNEELSTVNSQLKEKIDQLQSANDDVKNFFSSTDLPTIFLDPDLKIQRYTPAAEQLLKMGPRDLNRPIYSLGRELVDEDLTNECKAVLQNFQPIRKEKQSYDGRWFIRQVTPYRTEDRRVEGVVLVFQDVTEIKELSQRAESRENQHAVVAKLGMMALGGVDLDDLMHQTVRQVAHVLKADYCKILEHRKETHDFLMVAGVGWRDGLIGKATVNDNQGSQAGYTFLSQEPIIVNDLSKEKRFKGPPLLKDHHVTSGISCLIDHMDPAYGVIGAHTKEKREFTKDDANFLQSVANFLSAAIKTQRAQEKLFRSEEEFRVLANNISQLAWMTDETGAINWYNQRWHDYVGMNLQETSGWKWKRVHHPDHADRVVKHLKACIDAGESWEDTFPLRRYDGEYRWFLSRAVPIKNESGKIISWFGTNTDITEKLIREKALQESEEKLRLAMTTNDLGSFEYYFQKEKTTWDDSLKEIWGLRQNENLTQEIFWDGVHDEDKAYVKDCLDRAINGDNDGYYHAEYRVVNRLNENISWVEATGQTIYENGKAVKMIGMVINITDRKEMEENLQMAVQGLRENDTRKDEFLSILGHELRNPLGALSGSIEILSKTVEKNDKLFGVMRHSVATMGRLLDDLLDLNRISEGKIQLSKTPVEIETLIDNVLNTVQSKIDEKKHKLKMSIEPGLLVYGDATRLEQVLTNLIVNACKYTPSGGKISLATKQSGANIKIEIQDNGLGIDQKLLKKIFQPFYQYKHEGRASAGLGIGLALSKKLVELHDGKIRAFSDGDDKGSTFTVTLPALSHDNINYNTDEIESAGHDIRENLKVLIIEDNEELLYTMPILLEFLNCKTKTANNGKDGIKLVKTFKPDAMLVDIGLPSMTGYEIVRKLRQDGYKGMMIAMSGYGHTKAKREAEKAGFDYHMAKPADLNEIARLLSKIE